MSTTDFTALHDSMESYFKTTIKHIRTVQTYNGEVPKDRIQTPAILVGLEEMEQGKMLSGGRLAMDCIFSAYCLLSAQTKRADLEIRNMAAVVACKLSKQRWGLADAVSIPTNITAVPGIFENDQPGLECWVVSWRQTVHIGEAWAPDDGPFDGFWLAGCHDALHRLPDFPKEPEVAP
ncbi:MAG: hypothetical protein ACRC8R_12230 [Aeromonas hydrophila]